MAPASYIRSFFGICHSGFFDAYDGLGASWCRVDFSWHRIEPSEGRFEFEHYDRLMDEALRYGVDILPILCYCAPWASRGNSVTYPPKNISHWTRYVEAVVSRYSVPPYNVKYFEVWNEPNIEVFWKLDWERYIDDILIPAAEVIHSYGCYVVAPSVTLEHLGESTFTYEFLRRWSPEACITRLDEWLSYHDAWEHIDIVSIHYSKGDTGGEKGLGSGNLMAVYNHLYDEWVKPGKVRGIWNTEEGLTAVYDEQHRQVGLEPWEDKPLGQWVARYIIPVLHWSLTHGWDFKDKYKLFWYRISGGSPEAPLYNTCIIGVNGELTDVGKAYRVIAKKLFKDDVAVSRWNVEVKPRNRVIETYSFTVDGNLLIVFWTRVRGKFRVRLFSARGEFKRCQMIDYISGARRDCRLLEENGDIIAEVDVRDPIAYVELYTT